MMTAGHQTQARQSPLAVSGLIAQAARSCAALAASPAVERSRRFRTLSLPGGAGDHSSTWRALLARRCRGRRRSPPTCRRRDLLAAGRRGFSASSLSVTVDLAVKRQRPAAYTISSARRAGEDCRSSARRWPSCRPFSACRSSRLHGRRSRARRTPSRRRRSRRPCRSSRLLLLRPISSSCSTLIMAVTLLPAVAAGAGPLRLQHHEHRRWRSRRFPRQQRHQRQPLRSAHAQRQALVGALRRKALMTAGRLLVALSSAPSSAPARPRCRRDQLLVAARKWSRKGPSPSADHRRRRQATSRTSAAGTRTSGSPRGTLHR